MWLATSNVIITDGSTFFYLYICPIRRMIVWLGKSRHLIISMLFQFSICFHTVYINPSRQRFSPSLSVAMISILLGVLEYHRFILYVGHDIHIFVIEQIELLQRLQICTMHVECVTNTTITLTNTNCN